MVVEDGNDLDGLVESLMILYPKRDDEPTVLPHILTGIGTPPGSPVK
jgi:hypothetical protein